MENSFGDYLRELRGNKTLREIATLTGLSHTYIRDLELGINRKTNKAPTPSHDTLAKLAKAYGIKYGDLSSRHFNNLNIPAYVPRDEPYNKNSMGSITLTIGDEMYFDEEAYELIKKLKADKENKTKYRVVYQYNTKHDGNQKDKELLFFLKQHHISYNGKQLTEQDRQRILDMLKVLFPDRQ